VIDALERPRICETVWTGVPPSKHHCGRGVAPVMEPDPSHASLGDQGIEPARERIGDDRAPSSSTKRKPLSCHASRARSRSSSWSPACEASWASGPKCHGQRTDHARVLRSGGQVLRITAALVPYPEARLAAAEVLDVTEVGA
jgi:hypothetical protein